MNKPKFLPPVSFRNLSISIMIFEFLYNPLLSSPN
jgi:hypothetical protein